MITIQNMSFAYKKHDVFRDLSLNVSKGGIYGLLGLNGSGKSTLLYLMCGLLRAKSGSVMYKGKDVKKRLPSVLSDMFIVPEEFELPNLTLSKYVEINSKFYPNFSMEMLDKSLAAFAMDKETNLAESSMGQRKKVFLCFALATNTSLLLMDEPTNGLDIPSKSMFRKAVAECMTDERTIIVSTHQVKDIENMLDHVLIIDNSNVILNETMDDISRKLRFEVERNTMPAADAIYSMQVGLDTLQVLPCSDVSNETPVNLEMLFNATLANREGINKVFNK